MKEKISISLDRKILERADEIIDGVNVRNRSQALEHLIRSALTSRSIDCAIILAGGSKENLKARDTYRPLVRVDGSPLIINAIRKLKAAGVGKILIAAGPITDRIFDMVGDGSEFGVAITYVQDKDAGTAGALRAAERFLDGGPFFVVLGDEYFDFDLNKMVDFHHSNSSMVTIAICVTELKRSDDYIRIVGNRITDFRYRTDEERTHHVNAGIYLMEPDALQHIPDRGSLEKTVLPELSRKGMLTAFIFSGKWVHVR
jgi:NDP-sugar pyrophosphorylase family protein